MGSFAMTCRPMTSFWQFSSAHEAFLQLFITILMGFLQALWLLAEDPSSLDPICSVSSAEASIVKVLFLADSLLDAPVLHQTLAALILKSSEQLLIWSHGYFSFSFPCPVTSSLGLSRHEIRRNQRANKAASGLLTSHGLGKGTGSCTSLFSLLSPSFPPYSNMGTVKQCK